MDPAARKHILHPTLIAFAVLAASGTACAEGSSADATLDLGIGWIGGDRADRGLFGQYNGLRERSTVGLFGLEYERRNADTGSVIRLQGVNLLGETRELDLRWQRQGDWSVRAEAGQWVRYEPLEPSSRDDLKIERTRFGVAYTKIVSPRLQFDVSLRSENKEGARLFGIGMSCPSAVAPGCGPTTGTEVGWAVLMRPEPIDANHSQVDARLTYAAGKLRLSAGYYGSYYRNRFGSMDPQVPSRLNNALGTVLPLSAGLQGILSQPVALPPDNQAHQLDLAGAYALAPTVSANFKIARGIATQTQDFAAAGFSLAPSGAANLGGRVDTTLVQLGLSARPWSGTTLRAKLRYRDRDDRTPLAPYNVEGSNVYTNRRLPYTKTSGTLEASHQFSADTRGSLGADHEDIDRGVFTASSAIAGITALRQKTYETGLRAELRHRLNEDVSGSIGLYSSRRDGSNWLRNNSGLGVTAEPDPSDPATGFATGVFMPTLADRRREKLKVQASWQASDSVALQLSAQGGRDTFDTPSVYGLRKAGMDQVNVDVSYAHSFAWTFTGYLSYGRETLLQARPEAVVLSLDNTSGSIGLGFNGKLSSALRVGGNLSYTDDKSGYAQTLDPAAGGAAAALLAATGGLPDIVLRQGMVNLFARYALDKQSDLQLDLVHRRSTWSDWAWAYNGVSFAYSDGIVVDPHARQQSTFIGLRYIYRWQP